MSKNKFNFHEIQFNYTGSRESLKKFIQDAPIFVEECKKSLINLIDDGYNSGAIMIPLTIDNAPGFTLVDVVFNKKEPTIKE